MDINTFDDIIATPVFPPLNYIFCTISNGTLNVIFTILAIAFIAFFTAQLVYTLTSFCYRYSDDKQDGRDPVTLALSTLILISYIAVLICGHYCSFMLKPLTKWVLAFLICGILLVTMCWLMVIQEACLSQTHMKIPLGISHICYILLFVAFITFCGMMDCFAMEARKCHFCFYILCGLCSVWLVVYSFFALSNYFGKIEEQNNTSCYKQFKPHFLALNLLLTAAATISAYQVNTYRLRMQEVELFNVVLSGLGMGFIISTVIILSKTYSEHKGTPFLTFIAVDIIVTIALLRCYYIGKAVLYQSYGKNYVPLSTWADDTLSDSCEEDQQSTATTESYPSLTEQNSPGDDTPLPPDDNFNESNALQCSIETDVENAALSPSEDAVSNVTTSLTTPIKAAASDYSHPFCQEEVTYILSRTGFIILCAGLAATLTSTLVMVGTVKDNDSETNGSKNQQLAYVLVALTTALTINTLLFIRLTNPLQGFYSIDQIFFTVLGSLIIIMIVGGAILLYMLAERKKKFQWNVSLPLAFYFIMILVTLIYYWG